MPENAIRIDRHTPGTRLDQLVTQKASEVLNAMPDASGRRDRRVSRYERSGGRKAYRASHYERSLTAKGRQARAQGAEIEGRPVRVRGDRTRSGGRPARGRRPVRGTGLHGGLDAAEGEVPAVHDAFHAQRALEDAAQPPRMGVGGPEGHVRHGVPGIRVGQGRDRRRGDGGQEAECRRELPAGENPGAYLLDEFPDGHRRRIRTSNMVERLNREIRRRKRVTGGFPDGDSALMLICTRICYVTANEWSTCRYLDMSRFDGNLVEAN